MKIPLGDILRSFVAPGSVLGKILKWTKGISIKKGSTTILLDHDHVYPGGEKPFDKPHKPGPPEIKIPGR
jgi:hypothetical protein